MSFATGLYISEIALTFGIHTHKQIIATCGGEYYDQMFVYVPSDGARIFHLYLKTELSYLLQLNELIERRLLLNYQYDRHSSLDISTYKCIDRHGLLIILITLVNGFRHKAGRVS